MSRDQVIKVGGINVHISPYAFQHYAKDFYEAYKKHKRGPKFSPARFFLITRSIELAAKSLHLGRGRTAEYLRKLGHDLEAACNSSVLRHYQISLTKDEKSELQKANDYYKCKGFEYFLLSLPSAHKDKTGPQLALSGWPGLPDESILEALLAKLLSPNL